MLLKDRQREGGGWVVGGVGGRGEARAECQTERRQTAGGQTQGLVDARVHNSSRREETFRLFRFYRDIWL